VTRGLESAGLHREVRGFCRTGNVGSIGGIHGNSGSCVVTRATEEGGIAQGFSIRGELGDEGAGTRDVVRKVRNGCRSEDALERTGSRGEIR
jgi:hypothetical protein